MTGEIELIRRIRETWSGDESKMIDLNTQAAENVSVVGGVLRAVGFQAVSFMPRGWLLFRRRSTWWIGRGDPHWHVTSEDLERVRWAREKYTLERVVSGWKPGGIREQLSSWWREKP